MLHSAVAEARVRVAPRLALGASYRLAYRHSTYRSGAARTLTAPEVRVFASTALPWWNH
jgi:hypothetical protein